MTEEDDGQEADDLDEGDVRNADENSDENSDRNSVEDHDFDLEEIKWECPPVDRREFPSWEELVRYVKEYGKRTHQVSCPRNHYVIRNSTRTSKRNNEVRKKKKFHSSMLIDETKFPYYSRQFKCTHAGQLRSRSTGKRPRQSHRSTQCPAHLNSAVQFNGNVWTANITTTMTTHNHPVSAKHIAQLPITRTAISPAIQGVVEDLRRVDGGVRTIRDYIRLIDKPEITMQDVYNICAKMRQHEYSAPLVSKNHWGGVILDFKRRYFLIYEPRQAKDTSDVLRVFAKQNIRTALSFAPSSIQFRPASTAVRQGDNDSSNCGVLVLSWMRAYMNDQM
ncbi:TPA: hypothetical protein N0F65_000596 [Lagenidium giganteum]|uniref:Ubiquitin-like protease family profile domain-containing protein n=1 Tax=Lagenidium giganteum TaxID=4803 RepID=A0AAV2YIU3_9STRA|nr:TPA: hypothetical protein N0F65_000596 [Lagenidium giganteum]